MKISVATDSDTYSLEVSDEIELENFKVLCEVEVGIPSADMVLVFNAAPLTDGKKSLKDYGVKDGDLLMLMPGSSVLQRAAERVQQMHRNPEADGIDQFDFSSIQIPGGQSIREGNNTDPVAHSTDPNSSVQGQDHSDGAHGSNEGDGQDDDLGLGDTAGNQDDPAVIRDMLLANPEQLALLKHNNPKLAEALTSGSLDEFAKVLKEQQDGRRERERQRIRLLTADPFDMEAQRMIAEEIQQENINANMEAAMEFNPESFGTVHMLYINCHVNGHPVKAFIDSGAQTTIMSQVCAARCNIMRLVDHRWAGIAKGVGTQKIIGRVHMGQIQIEGDFLASSFCILEEQAMDMLLGLDMLRRHQMAIDLKGNKLLIGTTGTGTPFLPESELPECARLTYNAEEEARRQSELTANAENDQALAKALSQSAREQSQTPAADPMDGSSTSTSAPISASTPTSAPVSASAPSESDIEELIQIGFSRDAVVDELRKQNGNKTQAIAALFAKSIQM